MSLRVVSRSGLWLPGQGSTANGLTILVPPGHGDAERPPGFTCEVPVDHNSGRRCDAHFTLDQRDRFERHLARCAREHIDVIHAKKPSVRTPMLTEQAWDPEVAEHMRKVGERMKREGRMTVLPSERAGFS